MLFPAGTGAFVGSTDKKLAPLSISMSGWVAACVRAGVAAGRFPSLPAREPICARDVLQPSGRKWQVPFCHERKPRPCEFGTEKPGSPAPGFFWCRTNRSHFSWEPRGGLSRFRSKRLEMAVPSSQAPGFNAFGHDRELESRSPALPHPLREPGFFSLWPRKHARLQFQVDVAILLPAGRA